MTTADPLDAFMAWKTSSQPGQSHCYHRGFLAIDLIPGTTLCNSLSPVRQAVVAAYLTGAFELTQQRHATGDYSYFIVRRKVRDTSHRGWVTIGEKAEFRLGNNASAA